MKHLLRFVPVMAIAALMCSCLEMNVQFMVKKDGSGQITVHNLMSPNTLGGMGMMGGMGGADAKKPDPEAIKAEMKKDMMDEAKLKESAKSFGEDVTFKSVEFIERKDGFIGTKAIYEFKDLNKIQMEKLKTDKGGGGKSPMDRPLAFSFKKGDTPTLTVVMKKQEGDGEDPKKTPSEAEVNQQLGMMGMFAGMKMSISVKVDGTITETNAKHVSKKKNAILLMQMDLDKMMTDRANLTKAIMEGGDDPAAMAKFNVKGLKSQEVGKEIKVQFK